MKKYSSSDAVEDLLAERPRRLVAGPVTAEDRRRMHADIASGKAHNLACLQEMWGSRSAAEEVWRAYHAKRRRDLSSAEAGAMGSITQRASHMVRSGQVLCSEELAAALGISFTRAGEFFRRYSKPRAELRAAVSARRAA